MVEKVEKELTTDGHLKLLSERPGVIGYVIFNYEGIPMRHHPNITVEQAVHYAALINDYFNVTRKILTKDLKPLAEGNDSNDLETIRIRTKKGTEMIITWDMEYRMVCIQKFEQYEDENEEDEEEAKPEN